MPPNLPFLIHRQPQPQTTLSKCTTFYNIIMNLLSNVSSESAPEHQSAPINRECIGIVEEYYARVACEVFQENVLIYVLSAVQLQAGSVLMMPDLHCFLLRAIYSVISREEPSEHELILLKHLTTIYTALFSYLLSNESRPQPTLQIA